MAQPIRYASDQWAVVPKWHASPTIDGRIDEWMWGTAAMLRQFRTAYYEHSLGKTVEYQLAYDAGNLYIGGKIGREETDTLSHSEVLLRRSREIAGNGELAVPLQPEERSGKSTQAPPTTSSRSKR